MSLKNIYKRLIRFFMNRTTERFTNSHKYWVDRYDKSGNSGSGSYGRLAQFKANFLNEFVKTNDVNHVVELGCGDGNQLTYAKYPNYTGFDISNKAIEICEAKFNNDKTKSFYLLESKSNEKDIVKGDLLISLDVIFHLVEDDAFANYMYLLFKSSTKFVVIYSSNEDRNMVSHVKSRKFTEWVNNNISDDWVLVKEIKNDFPYDPKDPNNTSIANFYVYELINDYVL